jgi:hypothetical protein
MSANFSATAPRRAGSYSVGVTMTGASGLDLQASGGFNTNGYQSLHLSIFNISAPTNAIYLALTNSSGTSLTYVNLANYTGTGYVYAYGWYDIVIPLADLGATGQTVRDVLIQVAGTGNFFVDEVSFSTVSGSTYWVPPTVTSVTVSCTPSTVQVNYTSQCSATVLGTGNPDTSVTWLINGISNGNSTIGTLPSGYVSPYYLAPSTVPNPATVTITATSVLDPSKSGSTTITITLPPLTQASDTLFADAVGSGWVITGSQANLNTASDVAYVGDYGLLMQTTGTSGWVWIGTQSGYGFNTSGYDAVTFAINIGTYEGENLSVSLIGANGLPIQPVTLANYTSDQTLDAYQWQKVKILLSALNGVGTTVYGIRVQSANPATISLDEIKFELNGVCN